MSREQEFDDDLILDVLDLDLDLLRKAGLRPNGNAEDECAVLKALLLHENAGLQQIARLHRSDEEYLRFAARGLKERFPELLDETIFDYVIKNCSPMSDQSPSWIVSGLVLFPESEAKQIFRHRDGWEIFRERFPDSKGVAEISRVGFDKAVSQAITCYGHQYDWLAGRGEYIFLNRKHPNWEIVASTHAWVS